MAIFSSSGSARLISRAWSDKAFADPSDSVQSSIFNYDNQPHQSLKMLSILLSVNLKFN